MHLDLIDQHTAAHRTATDRIEVVIEPFRGLPRPDLHHPRYRRVHRRHRRRRNRSRHDQVPHRTTPRVVGGHHPGQQRIGRPRSNPVAHPAGQLLLARCPRYRAMVDLPYPRHLLAAKYRRIATRRGPLKATRRRSNAPLLVAIWNIATTNTTYHDPAATTSPASTRRKPETNAIPPARIHGYHVTLEQAFLTEPLTPRAHLTAIFSSARMFLLPLPKSAHPGAKAARRADLQRRGPRPRPAGGTKRSMPTTAPVAKAVAKISEHTDVLLAFYDYPAEHWIHLRTTNRVHLRHRPAAAADHQWTRLTAAGVAMAFKLIESRTSPLARRHYAPTSSLWSVPAPDSRKASSSNDRRIRRRSASRVKRRSTSLGLISRFCAIWA